MRREVRKKNNHPNYKWIAYISLVRTALNIKLTREIQKKTDWAHWQIQTSGGIRYELLFFSSSLFRIKYTPTACVRRCGSVKEIASVVCFEVGNTEQLIVCDWMSYTAANTLCELCIPHREVTSIQSVWCALFLDVSVYIVFFSFLVNNFFISHLTDTLVWTWYTVFRPKIKKTES